MSKKSRKRNKKILAVLGLAAAATAASRRNKGAVSTEGQPVGTNRMSANTPPIGGTDHIPKVKAKAIVDTPSNTSSNYLGKMTGHGTQSGDVGQKIRAAHAAAATAPKNINHPLHNPTRIRTHTARKFASGGRTGYSAGGAAKRGVSPILMKGKK